MTNDQWTRWEPRLDDMFADPIVTAIMRRDGLSEQDMREALKRARRSTALPRHGKGSLPAVVSAWSF
jgi:hypothetical protein